MISAPLVHIGSREQSVYDQMFSPTHNHNGSQPAYDGLSGPLWELYQQSRTIQDPSRRDAAMACLGHLVDIWAIEFGT